MSSPNRRRRVAAIRRNRRGPCWEGEAVGKVRVRLILSAGRERGIHPRTATMPSIESTTITPEDEANLKLAMDQAYKSLNEGGVPIGSVASSELDAFLPSSPRSSSPSSCLFHLRLANLQTLLVPALPSPHQDRSFCRPQSASAGQCSLSLAVALPPKPSPLTSVPSPSLCCFASCR